MNRSAEAVAQLQSSENTIADVQGSADTRRIAIDHVGVRGLRHPLRVRDKGAPQHTVASLDMYVNLAHDVKGTHMSRFVEILNEYDQELTAESFTQLVADMSARLEAESGHVVMRFPYFVEKAAPVSGVRSLLDYEVSFIGTFKEGVGCTELQVVVPVTSLCPCSKQISDYGAHNQRSHVTVKVRANSVHIEDIIEMVEAEASCELYGILKRPDEKFVTERAYDNPKFVEDMVRDVAKRLNDNDDVRAYTIESENFESIHNHSAYAMIENDKDA